MSDGTGTVTDIAHARSGSKRRASDGNVPNIELSSTEGTLRIGQILEEHRVHYRIVFEEIGTPVDKLRTFYDIFLAIRDVVIGACLVSHLHQDDPSLRVLTLSSQSLVLCQAHSSRCELRQHPSSSSAWTTTQGITCGSGIRKRHHYCDSTTRVSHCERSNIGKV